MIVKLAIRNLLHDRARFLVTLIGVLFAVVLLAVQLGLYLGARKMISGMVAHTTGDIWIAAYGANSFEQAPILTGRERFLALSVPGVASVSPLVVSFSGWRKPNSGTVNVIVIGDRDGGRKPQAVEHRRRPPPPHFAGWSDRGSLLCQDAGRFRSRRHGGNRRAAGAGGRFHERHPVLHHIALYFHEREEGAGNPVRAASIKPHSIL